jgi:hypothetical protein
MRVWLDHTDGQEAAAHGFGLHWDTTKRAVSTEDTAHGCARGHPPLPSAPGRDEPNAHSPLAGPVLQLNIDD